MSDGHGETTALNVPWTPPPAVRPGYGPDPGCQPCPDCGGLECLCRPRFFAGQLLTEQDLNRLDHYIVEKNKLHNRHLVGSGVVCGLEVLCDQCDERVRVTPGYAISPCGEDIVVCKPDYVDICALIDRCRKTDEVDCRPYAGKDGCEEVEEEWVLAIRYMESPARGMTALTGASSCGCGAPSASSCGCGAKSGAGCSCASSAAPAAANGEAPRLRRGAPPSCEPTLVCESYRYEIFRKPEEKDDKDRSGEDSDWLIASLAGVFERLDGDMARRITCCLRDLEKALPSPPSSDATNIPQQERQAWVSWACAVKRSLAAYLTRLGGGNCEAVAELGAILVPNANSANFDEEFQYAVMELVMVAVQSALHCICSNLLPACPPPEDPRIPLAVVTVRRTGCDIVKVCNWTPLRRHVTTFRSLDYWFGWLPLREFIRNAIEAVCCNTFGLPMRYEAGKTPDTSGKATVETAEAAAMQAKMDADAAAAPAAHTMKAEATTRPLDAPLQFELGSSPRRTGILRKTVRASFEADEPTAASLFDLTFRRPAFPARGGADAADDKRIEGGLAASGLVRTLAGVVRSSGVEEGAFGLLGLAAAAARGGGGDRREVAELRARLDRQDTEIVELRRSVEKAVASGRGGKS